MTSYMFLIIIDTSDCSPYNTSTARFDVGFIPMDLPVPSTLYFLGSNTLTDLNYMIEK